MYRITKSDNETTFSFMSTQKSKPHKVLLRSPYCYKDTGNIQIILNREQHRVEIHKSILAKTKVLPDSRRKQKAVGIDKGLATLLSCSTGSEYGEGFGVLANREADRITKRNAERNRFIQKKKDLNRQIRELDNEIRETGEYDRIPLIRQKKDLERQIQHIEEHNLGNKRYDREHARSVGAMETFLNYSIRQMIQAERPAEVVKEDLSFSKEKLSGEERRMHSARTRARLASWTKGVLNTRIEYICSQYNIQTTDVNPAYTSQFCATCGAPIDKRSGAHSEIAHCPNCGKINANTNAGRNILNRKDDPEITLYTPYKKVKTILMGRYEQATRQQSKGTDTNTETTAQPDRTKNNKVS